MTPDGAVVLAVLGVAAAWLLTYLTVVWAMRVFVRRTIPDPELNDMPLPGWMYLTAAVASAAFHAALFGLLPL